MDDVTWARSLNVFFSAIFARPNVEGYVCIALLPAKKRELREKFFKWPEQATEIADYVIKNYQGNNVYFCPQILAVRERKSEKVKTCTALWADLDDCPPDQLHVRPSFLLETSYQRFQALWLLESPLEPAEAEALSRKIAYAHEDEGADKSGWDLTQLLRVPGTFNLKYESELRVEIKHASRAMYRPEDFNAYAHISFEPRARIALPKPESLLSYPEPLDIIGAYRSVIDPRVFGLFSNPPAEGEFKEGWSGALWKLMMMSYEAGMDREEVFLVCQGAACNKYARDGRPPTELWNDIVRGYFQHQENIKTTLIPELVYVDLLTEEEIQLVQHRETFVSRYIKWASGLGDAAEQYHEAGAFVILSALLAGKVVLPTSFGNIVPNLWFMVLADTTLTRKSTAMDIATDLLIEVDADAIMATDGSIEGLLTGLSMRPGRPSIFLRDEFSGLLEAFSKKDYMAGMAETLTKLYDGKYSKRILRRETVEIRDPCLIIFAGGIRNRVQQLLTLDHVSSGFMPRFVYITAESDVSRVRPMGPPIVRDLSGRRILLDEMANMYDYYQAAGAPTRGVRLGPPPRVEAQLTAEAWERFNEFENMMLKAGVESDRPELLTPVYDRLGKSALKAAVLLAASEQREEDVTVEKVHILQAIYFATRWREYAIEVINGVGKSHYERDIERLVDAIKRRPGVSRSSLMQSYHLTAQTATQLFATMEQRGLVKGNKFGRTLCYWPADMKLPKNENANEEETSDESERV